MLKERTLFVVGGGVMVTTMIGKISQDNDPLMAYGCCRCLLSHEEENCDDGDDNCVFQETLALFLVVTRH